MPQSDRPSSPEETTAEQYSMYRLEHDLFELFEEQQMLLDIVAQQQERLERQLELQRLLLAESPTSNLQATHEATTPQLELEPRAANETQPAVEVAPQSTEPEAVPEVTAEPQVLTPLPLPLPLPLPPAHCICARLRQQSASLVVATCTTPKQTGLGYDTAFPYPKRISKSRHRRALFIFTVVENLVLQLQRFMQLPGNSNKLFLLSPMQQTNNLIIRELPEQGGSKAMIKSKPAAIETTGALPKPKINRYELTVKLNNNKLKGSSAKRLKKRLKKSTLQEQEMDMDCEFGMDYIQKFRSDSVREDHHQLPTDTCITNHIQLPDQSSAKQMPTMAGNSLEDQLSESLNKLNIYEEVVPQQAEQLPPGWLNAALASRPSSQHETRPCTPEQLPQVAPMKPIQQMPPVQTLVQLNAASPPPPPATTPTPPPLLLLLPPAVLADNGMIDLLPSTSAQARAMSLARQQSGGGSGGGDGPASLISSHHSSIMRYPVYSPPSTPTIASVASLLPANAPSCSYTIHDTGAFVASPADGTEPQVTPPPPPPPSPSPMSMSPMSMSLSMSINSFPYANVVNATLNDTLLSNLSHLPAKDNDSIQFNPFDARGDDFSHGGPSNYR